MTEHPLLMNGAMVRATLASTKTQTRRMVKPQPKMYEPGQDVGLSDYIADMLVCPYGRVGGRIWIRETFYAYGRWITRYSEKKGRDEWHFIDMTVECDRAYQYEADSPEVPLATGRGGALPGWYKRPAIFMPRAACRILLGITGVRVERLKECSVDDAVDEGIERVRADDDRVCYWKDYLTGGRTNHQVYSYRTLWESINGAGSWTANPWVWVVEFKRVMP